MPACLRAIGFAENDDTWELVPNEAAWNVLLRSVIGPLAIEHV